MQNTEIDRLVQQASASGSPEDLKALWKATLGLEKWYFITRNQDSLQDRKPFIGVIENKPWVFVFTDKHKAQLFGSSDPGAGFTDTSGSVMIIAMETSRALEYVMELQQIGVYGIRLNEGNGWFSPISNLPSIVAYVNQ
ncbi:MAG: hypothetical protein EOP49_13420 [Sphingobacteriales bacterium]|nr:MAG: hypothetical protein EOP49_13420 [Sphingobacteriales bacterium]